MGCMYMDRCPSASGWCSGNEQHYEKCIPLLLDGILRRDETIRALEGKTRNPRVFYLCDRRACDSCNPDCAHTSDVRHAVNFEVSSVKNPDGPIFTEK